MVGALLRLHREGLLHVQMHDPPVLAASFRVLCNLLNLSLSGPTGYIHYGCYAERDRKLFPIIILRCGKLIVWEAGVVEPRFNNDSIEHRRCASCCPPYAATRAACSESHHRFSRHGDLDGGTPAGSDSQSSRLAAKRKDNKKGMKRKSYPDLTLGESHE